MTAIVHDSQLPYYQQLYDILRRQITSGFWKPGDRLPSEAELTDQYQVSRIVVRQAFDMLVNEGWVYRRRGRGTFVTTPTIEHGLTRIISFTEDMQRRGLKPGTKILSARLEPASPEVAEKLNLMPGTELAVLERLRLADGEPMSIEISHLVHRLCNGILKADYANTPLHEALMDRYDIRLVRATQAIRSVAADKTVAAQLDIAPKAPLFYIERISYSQFGLPVEFLQLYHRGDRYVLYNELRN
jgi:GntR family transcriptional regulator